MATNSPFLKSPYQALIEEQEAALMPGSDPVQEVELPELEASPAPEPKPQTARSASPKPKAPASLVPPAEMRELFEATASHYQVPVNVLMAIAQQESSYDPSAENAESGAKGMVQYISATAKSLGINAADPNEAIPAAAFQLRQRLDKGLSMDDAVREHFAGPDRKLWGPKTAAYGDEVLKKAGLIGDELYGKIEAPQAEPAATTDSTPLPNFGINPDALKRIQAQWNAATPEERKQMEALRGPRGYIARELNKRHPAKQAAPNPLGLTVDPVAQVNEAYKNPTLDMIDPRAEARARNLVNQGMEGNTANKVARAAALADMTPGTEPGIGQRIENSNFDFATRRKFQEDPFFSNPAVRGAVKGVEGYKRGILGLNQMAAEVLGADNLAGSLREAGAESREHEAAMGQADSYGQRMFEGAVSSIAQQVPALVGGAVTGSEALVLGTMFAQTFGSEYSEGRARGQNEEQAMGRAALYGTFEVVGEKLGLGDTLKGLRGAVDGATTKDVATSMARALLKEIPGEQLTTLGQFGTDQLGGGYGLNTEAGLADYLQQAADTAVQTVIQGGIMGGVTTGASAIGNRIAGPRPVQTGAQAPAVPLDTGPEGRIEPVLGDTPSEPQQVAPSGPLTAALSEAAATVEDEGFTAQVMGDDGRMYTVDSRTGIAAPAEETAPAGPLESAIAEAAELHAADPAPTPILPQAEPAAPDYTAMPVDELKAQVQQLAAQDKQATDPEQRKKLRAERKTVEKEISARAKQAQLDSKPAEEPMSMGPFDDIKAANKMMMRYAEKTSVPHEVIEANGKFRIKPLEASDGLDTAGASGRTDGLGRGIGSVGGARDADGGPSERTGTVPDGESTHPVAERKSDDANNPADPVSAANPDEAVAPVKNPYAAYAASKPEFAEAYMDKRGIDRDKFEVKQTGPVRWQVVPRAAAKAEPKAIDVFHGTGGDFAEFSDEGLGSHFTTDATVASAFAESFKEGGNVRKVKLSIRNPLRAKDHGGSHTDARSVAESLAEEGHLPADYVGDAFFERLMNGPNGEYLTGDAYRQSNLRELERIKDILKAKGYDSIVYENTVEGGGDTYIAFDKSQIQSHAAQDSTTTPAKESADVSERPQVPEEAQVEAGAQSTVQADASDRAESADAAAGTSAAPAKPKRKVNESVARRQQANAKQEEAVEKAKASLAARAAKKVEHFTDETTGSHSGQTNHMLTMRDGDGKELGHVEYTVYQGVPQISMIDVPKANRRKGYGAKLVMELQRNFPETEIDWGGMTDDGAALYKSLEMREVPTEDAAKFARLEAARKERDALLQKAEEFQAIDNPTDKQRTDYYDEIAPINDLHDEIDDLERELSGAKPSKKLIAGRKKSAESQQAAVEQPPAPIQQEAKPKRKPAAKKQAEPVEEAEGVRYSVSGDAPAFAKNLSEAVNLAEAGFHFEEGGCWGMALALHEKLSALDRKPRIIVVPEPFTHAYVQADGLYYDHTGTRTSLPEGSSTENHSPESLIKRADDFGVDAAQVEADRAEAASIIENAEEMAQGVRYSVSAAIEAELPAIDPFVQALANAGVIRLHDSAATLPEGAGSIAQDIQAVTARDGTIHLVASNLDGNARGIVLHEAFHSGGKALVGTKVWRDLMQRLGALYQQGQSTSGAANAFWKAAKRRVTVAQLKGAVAEGMEHEEFGAYAIEEYANAPLTVRKWVDDLIGAIKAWVLRRFGAQLGSVTPAQLMALAKVALLDVRASRMEPAYSVSGSLPAGAAAPTQAETERNRALTPPEQGLLRRVQAQIQDGMNRVKQVQERITELTGVKDFGGADVYRAETNRPGRIAAKKEDARDKLIDPMMKRLAKAGYTPAQLSELLHAQHAEERNAAVAAINPEFPDSGSGLTNAQAQEILERYEGEAALLALADEARNIARSTLDLKLAYGLMTQIQYDTLAISYDNYVPLKGDGEYGPKVKRAMGHEEREEHILENIARDYEQAIVVGEKNLARQSLLQLVLQHPDDALWTARVPPKGRYVAGTVFNISRKGSADIEASFTSQSQVAAWLEAMGAAASQYEVNTSGGEQVVEFTKPLQDNEVMVYVKGDPVRIQLKDEKLARQLRPLKSEQMNAVLELMRKHNRYLSMIFTGYNPAFIIKNASRDAITGTINMTGNHGVTTAAKAWAKYPMAWTTMLKWAATKKVPDTEMGRMLTEYRAQGGKVGASYMSDLEEQGKSLQRMYDDAKGVKGYAAEGKIGKAAWIAARKAVGGAAHAIEILNQAFENALRLALFAQLRAEGKKPGVAAAAAKSVTVNFDRKGAMTAQMGAFYLFINPAIQGTANATITLTRGEHKYQAWALTGMMAAAGFGMAALGMDDDKDRWLGEKWDTRTKNLRLRVGDTTINIPMSQEFAPFYAIGVAMGEVSRGESSMKAAANVMSSFLDAYYPMQGAVQPDSDNPGLDLLLAHIPTVLKTPAQIATNRNSFGSKVVPETENTKNRPDNLKMNRATKGSVYDKAAQALATGKPYENNLSKVSPETLKLLWSTYTGGLGRFVADTVGAGNLARQAGVDMELSDVPIVKDFAKPDNVNAIRSRFYDLSDEAKKTVDEFNAAKKALDGDAMREITSNPVKKAHIGLARMVKSINEVQTIYAEQAVAINADKKLNDADKRARLKQLEAEQEAIYRKAIQAFQQ